MTLRRGVAVAGACVLALLAAACASSEKSSGGSSGAGELPACPVAALDGAKGPVTITLWHSMTRANEDALKKIVSGFEAANPKVKVELVNQTSYDVSLQKFEQGLSTGDVPDIVQFQETSLQVAIDSGAILPAQSCVNAAHYDTGDFVDRIRSFYTVEGVLWPMPFSTSDLVFLYDKSDFRRAGLDPDRPPTNFAELRSVAEKLKSAGIKTPLALKQDPAYLENWLSMAGSTFVNNGNGRTDRATQAVFAGPTGKESFAFVDGLVKEGLATTSDPGAFDHLLAIANGESSATIDSAASLGTVEQVLASGGAPDKQIEVGVAAMPGPTGNQGTLIGGSALYMSRRSSAEKQAAAWKFVQYVNQPDVQAAFAAATGYVPSRKSAVREPVLEEKWAQDPKFRVGFDVLLTGPESDATAGAVVGPFSEIRKAVRVQMQRMATGGVAPDAAITAAQNDANTLISDYNARLPR